MKRLIQRREKAAYWDIVPARVHVKLRTIAKAIMKLIVVKVSPIKFEVLDQVMDRERHYIVDYADTYCECARWHISGIPMQAYFSLHIHCSLRKLSLPLHIPTHSTVITRLRKLA